MKKLLPLFIFLSGILLPLKAENTSPTYYTISLSQGTNPDSEKFKCEDPKKVHRLPTRPVECYISLTDGVVIPTVDISEIISYQIYDLSEICKSLSVTDKTERWCSYK